MAFLKQLLSDIPCEDGNAKHTKVPALKTNYY